MTVHFQKFIIMDCCFRVRVAFEDSLLKEITALESIGPWSKVLEYRNEVRALISHLPPFTLLPSIFP